MESAIDPFIFLPLYRVIICKKCRLACVANEVIAHLTQNGNHQREFTAQQARDIAGRVQQKPGIFRTQAELKDFQFPPPHHAAIPFLEDPITDGLKCRECNDIYRQTQAMQNHCKGHGWVNPRRPGGNAAKHSNNIPELPYITGVRCQRFFKNRQASKWFQVEGARQDPEPITTSATGSDDDAKGCIRRAATHGLLRVTRRQEQLVQEADMKSEPNLWVRRVGCVPHLAGIDRRRLMETIRAPKEDEPLLQQVCESIRRMVRAAQVTCKAGIVGRAALFEVERKQMASKPRKPFDSQLEEDSFEKYLHVLEQVICYLFRIEENWEADERPAYRLTAKQEAAYDKLIGKLEDMNGTIGDSQHETVDQLTLELCMALFDHQLKDSEYDSVIISALAVMMMRQDGGWQPATDATPRYSALIKIARMLVIRQSYIERQEQVAHLKESMSEQKAREQAEGIFDLVRSRVQRYMTLVGESGQPTPMDWLYDTRSYGLKIRYTTAEEGQLDWKGDIVMCQKVQFSMNQLSDMIHSLVDEARNTMAKLLMLEKRADFPPICWDGLVDDASEDRMGWYFVKDPRNQWDVDGRWWLLDRISERDSALGQEWIKEIRADGVRFRSQAMKEYERLLEKFLEVLLVLVHLCGGQPARGPEILGLRYRNTSQGGIRNIVIEGGQVGFVAVYHKGFRATDQAKVIHRFVPREIGELIVWLVWLVLPFWQRIQVMEDDADEVSALLWADNVAWRSSQPGNERQQINGLDGQGHQRKWTPDRLRRALQKHSLRFIGQKLNISMWRHIAIGISRKYCRGGFGLEEEEGGGYNEEDDDEGEGGSNDSAWDLQTEPVCKSNPALGTIFHWVQLVQASRKYRGSVPILQGRAGYQFLLLVKSGGQGGGCVPISQIKIRAYRVNRGPYYYFWGKI